MATKKPLVAVPKALITAINDLHQSRYWTLLPAELRGRIEGNLEFYTINGSKIGRGS